MNDIIEQITDALNKIYQDELESYLKEQQQILFPALPLEKVRSLQKNI